MRTFILVALTHAATALQLPVTMPPLPKWSTQLNVDSLPTPPQIKLPSLPDPTAVKLPEIQAPTLPQAPDGSVTDLATRLLSEAQHALQGDWTPYATVMAASCAATVALTLPALLLTGAAERKRLERTATQLPGRRKLRTRVAPTTTRPPKLNNSTLKGRCSLPNDSRG